MVRVIVEVIWLALGAVLAVWVLEGLLAVDRSRGLVPVGESGGPPVVLLVGVAWGIATVAVALVTMLRPVTGRDGGPGTRLAVGRILEAHRTGLSQEAADGISRPLWDLVVRIDPDGEEPFLGLLRRRMAHPVLGSGIAVRYRPEDPDLLIGLDEETVRSEEVRDLQLRWRIREGLIPAELVRARTEGRRMVAHVLDLRPTGRMIGSAGELELQVLVTAPDGRRWEAGTRTFVEQGILRRVQIGAAVTAFARPQHPAAVALAPEIPLRTAADPAEEAR